MRSGKLIVVIGIACSILVGECLHASDPGENSGGGRVGLLTEADWPNWRGPNHDGSTMTDDEVPLTWNQETGIAWQSPLPGRGHGSAIVVGDQVIITSADAETEQQAVHCIDRATGDSLWVSVVHRGGFAKKMNSKATLASSTPACDGERIYVNFLNDGAVYTTALDRQGDQLWQTKISDYVIHQGYGSSPFVHGDLVIVAADNKGGGAVTALSRKTGKQVWTHARPTKPNYASPIVLNADGKDQLILTGCDRVQSLDPVSGSKLWEIEGATTECVTSTVTDGRVVFSSGGYPRNHISAYLADGSGQLAWEDTTRVYVPSMLIRDGFLFGVADAGIAFCRSAATGEKRWEARVSGTFSSSPVLINDRIYVTSESGATYVFAADPEQYQLLAKNQLGDSVFASPAVSRGCIYQRVARDIDGQRQEFLVCIGRPALVAN